MIPAVFFCQRVDYTAIFFVVQCEACVVAPSQAVPTSSYSSLSSGGFRNLERGVQPLACEVHPNIFGLSRPLPVT